MEDEDSISTVTSAYLEDEETNKRLDEATSSLHQQPNYLMLGEINSVKVNTIALKPRPSLVPHFIGRDDILEALYATHFTERSPELHGPTISVLRGLGGSGKTQIGLKFALDFEAKFPKVPVYFLNASSELNLEADYQTLIRVQGSSRRSSTYEDTLVWLATEQKEWLAILDNADDPTLELFRYIPKSKLGHVIITTRNDTYSGLAPNSSHHVEGLTVMEGTSLLLRIARYPEDGTNRAFAEKIAQVFGCLPLAVTHAGAYIGTHRCISTYLKTYNQSKAKLMTSRPNTLPQDYRASVATTIQMSLDRLSPEARDVMHIFAQLNATSIAHDIIQRSAEQQFCQIDSRPDEEALNEQTIEQANALMAIFCRGEEWDEFEFNRIIEECLQYSLLRVTAQGEAKFYSMHILVQAYLQASLRTVRNFHSNQLAIRLLGSAITLDHDYTYLAYNRLLVPHIRLINVADVTGSGDHACFANVLREQGSPLLASRHLQLCLERRSRVLGDNHLGTMHAMNDLAMSYSQLGRHQDAMELRKRVLEILKPLLGDNHPDVVQVANNLAVSYQNLGQYQDALELQEKMLEMQKQRLDDDHPDIMYAMNNLAALYQDLGRYQDALEIQEKVLGMRRQILGDEHLDTAHSMNNLAGSYETLGRYQNALELQEKVLEVRKRLLGDEHPDTLLAMSNLASTLSDLERYQEALEMVEKVLEMRKQLLGDDHPDTVLAMNNLASTLSDMKRHQDAVKLMEEVLKMRIQLLDYNHPDTILAMNNLAASYSDLGRHHEALELKKQVLDMRQELLGDNHPDTVRAMHNLASTYSDLGQQQKALRLKEKVLDRMIQLLGDDHPDTIIAMSNLMNSYFSLKRYQDALELGEKVLQRRRQVLGEEHPDSMLSMWNLLVTLERLEMKGQLVILLREALPLYQRVYGKEHPNTVRIQEWLDKILRHSEDNSSSDWTTDDDEET